MQVLAEIGLATEGLHSKGLAEINLEECQVIVNLADRRLEPFLPPAFKGVLIHRPVLDPYGRQLAHARVERFGCLGGQRIVRQPADFAGG